MDALEPQLMIRQSEQSGRDLRERMTELDRQARELCTTSQWKALKEICLVGSGDSYHGDDSSGAAMLNRPRVGAMLGERKMRAGVLVVFDVRRHDAAQMTLVEDHEVIQTLAPYRSDHALDVSVLPR